MAYRHPHPELRDRVRALVERDGLRPVARRMRMADATIARIAGDLLVTEASELLAIARLRELGELGEAA